MKQLQDDGVLEYAPDEDGIFRAEAARGVLSYLLRDVRYRPDDPYYSLLEAVEFGLPQSHAINYKMVIVQSMNILKQKVVFLMINPASTLLLIILPTSVL